MFMSLFVAEQKVDTIASTQQKYGNSEYPNDWSQQIHSSIKWMRVDENVKPFDQHGPTFWRANQQVPVSDALIPTAYP